MAAVRDKAAVRDHAVKVRERAKPVPPKPDRFMANIETAFVQQIFHISQTKRKSNVKHHRQTDDLWPSFKIAEWAAFCHSKMLPHHLARFN